MMREAMLDFSTGTSAVIALAGVALLAPGVVKADSNLVAIEYKLKIEERGIGFWEKTGTELTRNGTIQLYNYACGFIGTTCIYDKESYKAIVGTITGSYRHDDGSEEHRLFIRSPAGLTVCKGAIDWVGADIDNESTVEVKVINDKSNNGFSFYAVVPKNRRGNGNWARADFRLTFSRHEDWHINKCWGDGTRLVNTKGKNLKQGMPQDYLY